MIGKDTFFCIKLQSYDIEKETKNIFLIPDKFAQRHKFEKWKGGKIRNEENSGMYFRRNEKRI
ncbi:MAG: hypothetical protein IJC02_06350 [Lachnospiraceae bacterium]|nr:hypothetical protein [Lachnospiraceae bacterium]MBQ6996343.1 hypothetical protein [Lachnospiraceae bacterium]